MNGYFQSMPVKVSHSDEFWNASDLIKKYPIKDNNWKYNKKLNKIILPNEASSKYDFDPWSRLIITWEYTDIDDRVLTGGWSWMFDDESKSVFEIRFSTVAGKAIKLYKATDDLY